jgi:predicted DNA-binding transcriptional regulator YafY
MDRTERFYKIERLLNGRRVVPLRRFLDELEVSRATFKRDIEYLRSRFNAPIEWDREAGGYRLQEGARFELPGLWFNASEAHALLVMRHLLANLEPGLLGEQMQPLMERLESMLGSKRYSTDQVRRRIKILQMAHRDMPLPHFSLLASAILDRKRIRITYYARGNDETTERDVSPQRLVHYRDNWYLDAWCHLRKGVRSFAVDAIRDAAPTDAAAKDVADDELDRVLGSGYGIFSGEQTQTARLRFTPSRARWVSREQWHSKQKGSFEKGGHYLLEFPYSDQRELVMDILRHGAEVEVLGPASLRKAVAEALASASALYKP